jgi:lysophospholipase L1-like esterase
MKILILSDSLALPREKPEVCRYEQTWPQLIRNDGHMVNQVSIGGATSADLLRQSVYHTSFHPDVVILQVGIVDCAPRFLTASEKKVLLKIPFAGKSLIRGLNKAWVRKLRNLTYVPLVPFKANIEGILKAFQACKCLCVAIIPARKEYETQLPGITDKIKTYNEVLERTPAGYISLDDFPDHGVMSDHHHLNEAGHSYIFMQIKELLKKTDVGS